ncbi:MAG: hypothetical protein SW833_05885 [Cyanobacteriota bacterium]|nr:hypothetical protein [Cyanobacteriota bacterium]
MLGEILQFIDSLIVRLPRSLSVPGKSLQDLARSLSSEDALLMRRAIEDDWSQVDFDEW